MATGTAAERALAAFAEAFADPFAPARAFKAAGGKVVGYLSPHGPVELIEAGGMLAVRLDGGCLVETPRADEFVEDLFDPTVRATCERILNGEMDFLDAVVFPRTSDSVQRLYYYLCERRRASASASALPALLFYDLLLTPGRVSAEHSYASLLRLRDSLNRLAPRPIDDAAVETAIDASEERRRLLQRCLDARRRAPPGLTGVESQHLLAASRRLPPPHFIQFAEQLAEALQGRVTATKAVRIVLAGNCPDTVELHAALEALGAIVVGDYHDRGEPAVGGGFDRGLPPLESITGRYRDILAPRTFPSDPEALARFAKDVAAQGVVFLFFREEEVLSWDYPGQRRALDAAGMPSVCLAGQPRRLDLGAVRATVSPLIARLATGEAAS